MLHTKFRGNRPEKIFYHIWAWQPSCRVTQMPRTNFCSPNPRRLHINLAMTGQAVSEEKMLENVAGRRTEAGP